MKAPIALKERHLTAAEFQGLAAVPPELEWFANLEYETEYGAHRHAADVMETPMSQTLVCDTG